ncbi:unnamed protein product [Aphanomyces euteiches]
MDAVKNMIKSLSTTNSSEDILHDVSISPFHDDEQGICQQFELALTENDATIAYVLNIPHPKRKIARPSTVSTPPKPQKKRGRKKALF